LSEKLRQAGNRLGRDAREHAERSVARPAPAQPPLLQLQALAGNAAVTQAIETGRRRRVRSSPHHQPDSASHVDLALDRAGTVFHRSLWEADWRPPDTERLTADEGDMTWDLYKAATSHFNLPGPAADVETRLQDLARGEEKLGRLVADFHASDATRRRLALARSGQIASDIGKLRARLYAERAHGRADTGEEVDLTALDHTEAAQRARLLDLVEKSLKSGHAVAENIHKLGELAKLEHEWPRAMKKLGGASEMLDTVHLALTVADPKRWHELVGELRKQLGAGEEHSAAGAAASVTEITKLVVEVVSTAAKIHLKAAGYLARARGLAAEAAACSEAAEHLAKNFGSIIGALGIALGVLVIVDDKASAAKKADAAVEIATGSTSLLATLAPQVLSKAAASGFGMAVTITWMEFKWIGSEVATKVLAAPIEGDLRRSYAGLRSHGNEVARQLAVTERLQDLQRGGKTNAERAGYAIALREGRDQLYRDVYEAATAWRDAPQAALANRYAEVGLPELIAAAGDPGADVTTVMAAAGGLLHGMMAAARDFDKVLKQNFRDHGFEVPKEETDEPKEADR
jgi:hypothetical protein